MMGLASIDVAVIVCGICAVYHILRRFNSWWYEPTLKNGMPPLPPGDMGWPVIGNMLTFLRAFKSSNPDAFISSFVSRFKRIGVYKAYMFGKPTILATTPEACRLVLMDDVHFMPGWPQSTVKLMGTKSFVGISYEEHKRLRKLTTAPLNGSEALSKYMKWIEERVVSALQNWSNKDQIYLLTELRKLTFNIIGYIFLRYESDVKVGALEREYSILNLGVRAMAINLPGTAYNKALKWFHGWWNRHGESWWQFFSQRLKKEDLGNRRKILTDEEIIDLLVMYLNAGHESSAHVTMWAILLLLEHPEIYAKAKAEQEKLVKKRSDRQDHLTFSELREMPYLQKVIDETLRLVNVSPMVFREALDDVEYNGYIIPKGWKTQVWIRNVHLDPEVYPDPMKFNPERWDKFIPKAGMFIPFGGGSRMCPGNELAKMEISVFLHYMLLHYEYLMSKKPLTNVMPIKSKHNDNVVENPFHKTRIHKYS